MDASKAGYVYVLQMDGHPYYKIGRTVNLNSRVSQISPQMPGRLYVVLARRVSDCHFWEKRLHDEFKRVRLNGEWFSLKPTDLEFIEAALLASQAESFLWTLIDRFKSDVDGICIATIEQYGRVIALACRRASRRVEHMYDLWFEMPLTTSGRSDPILEAEIVL